MLGRPTGKEDDEYEPGPALTIGAAVAVAQSAHAPPTSASAIV
jgi:hypothetical protein